MANTGGISVIIKKDAQGALVVTLATSRGQSTEKQSGYTVPSPLTGREPVIISAPDEGGWTGTPFREIRLAHSEYRLGPQRLPFDRVVRLGIEVVPAAVRRAEKEAEGVLAMKKAREAGIEILPRPELGKPFAFSLTGADGKKFSSSAFKGKVVLIDCWATWCTPCMAKMPDLKALYARHHAEGLEVIGVNFDHDMGRKNTIAIIQKLGLPWPEYFVPDDRQELWEEATGIRTLPRLLLIDREGILRWDGGPEEMKRRVTNLLRPTNGSE